MDETTIEIGPVLRHYFGSTIRGGHIPASNSYGCVEESYPVAYNVGSGRAPWDGWINVDLDEKADIKADIRCLDMIESDTADAVAAIHVLEHFYYWEAHDIINEWKRILKPGGKMIIEVPCMDKIFQYVANCMRAKEPLMNFMSVHAIWGDPKYKDPLMCHKVGFFQSQLRDILQECGMQNVKVCNARYHFPPRDMRFECEK